MKRTAHVTLRSAPVKRKLFVANDFASHVPENYAEALKRGAEPCDPKLVLTGMLLKACTP